MELIVVSFFTDIERHKAAPALLTSEEEISYQDLARRADAFTADLQSRLPANVTRPLILIETANHPEPIIAYIGALRAGWPVILAPQDAGHTDSRIVSTYRPNVIFSRDGSGWAARAGAPDPVEMHPDLAVLLSTSGTTGATKLVRLSRANLEANAAAIASYLDLRPEDRALTVLPFHYSYGMSVLHIHLSVGAALVLTEGSLIDAEVRALARRTDVTSLALVPTQFELLDDLSWLPKLRYITQAGGRIDPILAQRFAERAEAEGWKLFIMYGQTEAGPRMSYLPPQDARDWFHTIGRPIPGGAFHLLDDQGQVISATGQAGELVYEGPNVMLGYALEREDLAAPSGPSVLKTGDIAERLENGFYRITGRASRFVKLFGLRIGLDDVETRLRSDGLRAYVCGDDKRLVVFMHDQTPPQDLAQKIATWYKLPTSVVMVSRIDAVPALPSGKVDYAGLNRQAAALQPAPGPIQASQDSAQALQDQLVQVLQTNDIDMERSFVEMGGDSLAYLEMQLALTAQLGKVPPKWEHMPLRDLVSLKAGPEQPATGRTWALQTVPADLLARLAAITGVIALHSTDWKTGGGAFLLLILVGYSMARFQSSVLFSGNVLRTWRSMLTPILVCYFGLILLIALLWHPVGYHWFLLLGNFDTHVTFKGLVPYWFVSAYAQIVVISTLPFAVPDIRRAVQRAPFAAGLIALAGLTLAMTLQPWGLSDMPSGIHHRHPLGAMDLLVLGWCLFFAKDLARKAVMSGVIVAVWWLDWSNIGQSTTLFILLGSLAVVWNLSLPVPGPVATALLQCASMTLFIYIAHVPVISLVYRISSSSSEAFQFLLTTGITLITAYIMKSFYYYMAEKILGLFRAKTDSVAQRA